MTMDDGWNASAAAWIETIGRYGDWGRRHVLDGPMLARCRDRGFIRALDVGCGEGRFCRMLAAEGIDPIGIDPTTALIEHARKRHPAGDYRIGDASAIALADESVDLAIFYLSLVDIPDLDAAIAEAHRVLRPGGRLLIANLQAFNTAAVGLGWRNERDGARRFSFDHYLDERAVRAEWAGISIVNWHRPLGRYMAALLAAGFVLRHFDEPAPVGDDSAKAERYRRVPYFLIMEWEKCA